jgi:uncharacterized protein YjiS (DUF1127 family)
LTTNTRAITAISPAAKRRPGLLDGLRAAYARWQEQARIRYELQQMTTRELADLGLSPSDINDVASGAYRRGE